MPPHVAIYNPAEPIEVSQDAGVTSAAIVREIWNDKDDDFLDTTTATGNVIKLLAAPITGYVDDEPVYGAYDISGTPLQDERWVRISITAFLTADGETTDGVTGAVPLGTNAWFHLPDLPPQTGVRISLQVFTPGGQTLDRTPLKLSVVGNLASSPLGPMTSLANGSGIVPADRTTGLRSLIRGSEVTANDTATVTIARGAMVYEGLTLAFPQTTQTFNLNDSAAVALLAGENYRVTLSRTPAGAIAVTKGLKNEAVLWPVKPAANVYVESFIVSSVDGVAVTVAPASLQGGRKYAEFYARAGVGLVALVAMGEGIASDIRQHQSHEVPVGLTATATNRIWRLPDGTLSATLTDVEPIPGADLMWLFTTDAVGVTGIVDARRLVHRALTTAHVKLVYRAALSQVAAPALAVALGDFDFDCELEAVEYKLSAKDGTWTAGALKIDLRTFAPGAAVPFPAGGAGVGGVSIYTSSGTDDRRPSIAFDAASLRVYSIDHEVRRFLAGTSVVLDLVTTVAAPGAEPGQELRVTLHVRRYR